MSKRTNVTVREAMALSGGTHQRELDDAKGRKTQGEESAYSDKNEQLFQIVNFDEKYTDSDNLNTDSDNLNTDSNNLNSDSDNLNSDSNQNER